MILVNFWAVCFEKCFSRNRNSDITYWSISSSISSFRFRGSRSTTCCSSYLSPFCSNFCKQYMYSRTLILVSSDILLLFIYRFIASSCFSNFSRFLPNSIKICCMQETVQANIPHVMNLMMIKLAVSPTDVGAMFWFI